MSQRQQLGILCLALLLPGAIVFFVLSQLFNPFFKIVIQPTSQTSGNTTPKTVHRRAVPENAGNDPVAPQTVPIVAGALPLPAHADAPMAPQNTAGSTHRRPVSGTSPAPVQQSASARDGGQAPTPQGPPRDAHAGNRHPVPPSLATQQLVHLFLGIGQLAGDNQSSITPAEAKALLAVIMPLRTQQQLTPAQAEQVTRQLQTQLTAVQREAIAKMPEKGPPSGDSGGPTPPPPTGGGQDLSAMVPPQGEPGQPMPPPDGGGEDTPAMGPPPQGPGDGAPPTGGHPGMPRNLANMNPFDITHANPMTLGFQAIFSALKERARHQ